MSRLLIMEFTSCNLRVGVEAAVSLGGDLEALPMGEVGKV